MINFVLRTTKKKKKKKKKKKNYIYYVYIYINKLTTTIKPVLMLIRSIRTVL